ncbi:glutamate receptor 1-like [Palaemon carinicauda]|uniref:glutamate receptor 1-like n=1 Tax=Palaemon carinicauda TaxID=392227 RepID=UPI0035B6872A
MSAAIYSITENRASAMDFSEPVYIDELTVGYVRPILQSDMMGFLKPYTDEMWVGIMLGVLSISVSIYIIMQAQRYIAGIHNSMYTINIPHVTGIPWFPTGNSGRVVACTWLLMAFILSCVYRSNLMAMLVSPKVQLPFSSLEELAKTDITLWVPAGSRFHEALTAASPTSTIGRVKKNTFLSANGLQGLKGYQNGQWSLITYKGPLTYTLHRDFSQQVITLIKLPIISFPITQHGYCRFYIMPEGIFKVNLLSLGFPKNSSLKPPVDKIIRNLREFGIIDHLFQKQVSNATECLKPLGYEIERAKKALALQDFYGVFSIYLAGLVLSLASFLLELKRCVHQ